MPASGKKGGGGRDAHLVLVEARQGHPLNAQREGARVADLKTKKNSRDWSLAGHPVLWGKAGCRVDGGRSP